MLINEVRSPLPPAAARALLGHLLEVVTLIEATGRVAWSSGDDSGALGYPPREWAELDLWARIHPDDLGIVHRAFEELLASPGGIVTGEFRVRAASGSWVDTEARGVNLLDDPEVGFIVLGTRDVSDRTGRFRALVEHLSDHLVIVGLDGVVQYLTPELARYAGFPNGEMPTSIDLIALCLADDRKRLAAAARTVIGCSPGATHDEIVRVQADGVTRWLEVRLHNQVGVVGVDGLVVVGRDVTERVSVQLALEYQALHDPLTGLPNRALLIDRMSQAIAATARTPSWVAVLFVDLDGFKMVNDSLGHAGGDTVLEQVARRLVTAVRPADTVARLGGDEFVVLCGGLATLDQAEIVAARVSAAFERPVPVAGRGSVSVTASVGVAVGRHGITAEQLLQDADLAMFEAKQRGRGQQARFDPQLRQQLRGRTALGYELRRALERDELRLVYQPVVDLHTGTVDGAEALLRWEHPERGEISPAHFLVAAVDFGMTDQIDEWVVRRAAMETATWLSAQASSQGPRRWRTWVNVFPHELTAPRLIDHVSRAIAESGLSPTCLGIEITEQALIHDHEGAARRLTQLRDLGVYSALDDFGTGYSSLAWLQQLPVDALKLDRSFVSPLALGRRQPASIVAAIVTLGHALDLDVVAEGVETIEQLEAVRVLGCDLAQGFHLGRPGALADIPVSVPALVSLGPPRPETSVTR